MDQDRGASRDRRQQGDVLPVGELSAWVCPFAVHDHRARSGHTREALAEPIGQRPDDVADGRALGLDARRASELAQGGEQPNGHVRHGPRLSPGTGPAVPCEAP